MSIYPSEDLNVACLQMDIKWCSIEENLAAVESYLFSAPSADLYLLPETFASGFATEKKLLFEVSTNDFVDAITKALKRWSFQKKAWVGGTIFMREGNHFRNRFIMASPDGEITYYDKRHRFSMAGEGEYFDRGDTRVVMQIKGWRLLLAICYDLRFPVWLRQQSNNGEPEYDGLLIPANWPEARHSAWETLLKARAIENQCYVLGVNRVGLDGFGVNYVGGSLSIGPWGDVGKEMPKTKTGWISTTWEAIHLSAVRKRYPFLKDADLFSI